MKYFLMALLLSAPVIAGSIYMDGRAIDSLYCKSHGSDIYCVTEDDPTEPPIDPPPIDPPEPPGCPSEGQLPMTQPQLDLRSPGAQVQVGSSGYTAGILVGTHNSGRITYGARPGSSSTAKTAIIATCPIWDPQYMVGPRCYGVGSGSLSVPYNVADCGLVEGRTYFLLYGDSRCTPSTCNSVRTVYSQ